MRAHGYRSPSTVWKAAVAEVAPGTTHEHVHMTAVRILVEGMISLGLLDGDVDARIEDESYGYCYETGEPIGLDRLEARPIATLSIEAQERREQLERQYSDRG